MRIADKRGGKRQPWNTRVVRCVLEHLSAKATGRDQLVLVHLARHAHPAGCGVMVGADTIHEATGYHKRTVLDARDALVAAGVLMRDGRGPAGVYRYRIALCERCSQYTAARECQKCNLYTAGKRRRRARSGVASAPEQKELQVVPTGTPVSTGSRPAAASPNGDGRAGASRRPPNTPSGRRQAADAAFKPSNQARQATAGAVIPFKAPRPLPSDHGEPSIPHYAAAPSAATGDPVLHPGRLFEPEPEQDPARWAR